jgi:carbon storage regulator CsrA
MGFLVLHRRAGESIFIGESQEIKITMLGYNPRYGSIKIGIDAPRKLPVLREEVFERNKNNFINNINEEK